MTKASRFFPLLIYLPLFAYVLARARLLSFTHDESLSYLLIAGDEGRANTANHHLLNTWLMQLFSKLAGESELVLRLPNVLAFALLLFYLHKLIVRFQIKAAWFTILPLIVFNPYILDFFSLARGYGLSLGFMMGAVFHLLRFVCPSPNEQKLRDYFACMFFACLSLLSNLGLVNFYIATLFICIFSYLLSRNYKAIWKFTGISLLAMLPLVFCTLRLLFLKEKGELYYGTEDFDYTVGSLIERSFYLSPYPPVLGDSIKKAILYLVPSGFIFAVVLRKWRSAFFVFSFLLVSIITGLLTEKTFFDALYPAGRTGIYLIPLFAIFLGLLVDQLGNLLPQKSAPFVMIPFSVIITAFTAFHFWGKINLNYCFDWKYDANTRAAVNTVLQKNTGSGKKPVMAVTWLFEPAVKYYILSQQLPLDVIKWEQQKTTMDAVYTLDDTPPENDWELETKYPETSSALYFRAGSGTMQ